MECHVCAKDISEGKLCNDCLQKRKKINRKLLINLAGFFVSLVLAAFSNNFMPEVKIFFVLPWLYFMLRFSFALHESYKFNDALRAFVIYDKEESTEVNEDALQRYLNSKKG